MVVHGLRGYSSSLVYCLECFDTVIWQQEGHPAGKNTECSYAGGGDITGTRCKWFAYVSELQLSLPTPPSYLAEVKPRVVWHSGTCLSRLLLKLAVNIWMCVCVCCNAYVYICVCWFCCLILWVRNDSFSLQLSTGWFFSTSLENCSVRRKNSSWWLLTDAVGTCWYWADWWSSIDARQHYQAGGHKNGWSKVCICQT